MSWLCCRATTLVVSAGMLALASILSGAQASVVTYNFTGHLNFNPFGPFALNDPITGSFSFETTTAYGPGGTPQQRVFPGALTAFQFTIGSYAASAPSGYVLLRDNFDCCDEFFAGSSASGNGLVGLPVNGLPLNDAYFRLTDPSQSMFTTTATLPTQLDLSLLPMQFQVNFSGWTMRGVITEGSLASVGAVPLPGALPLFASVLGGLACLRWLRRRQATARV